MLRFNESNSSFILYTNDNIRAESAGLTLSTNIRGPGGEKVFFTADHDKEPEYNPYAVLDYYSEADDKAKAKLACFRDDYLSSWDDGLTGSFPDYPVPEGKAYLPYQNAGIAYGLEHDNCIIGDEPGLGKTIQAIGIANATGARRILVLCPASIRLNWIREIHEWSMIERIRTHATLKGADGIGVGADWVVCSYDLARNPNIHKAITSRDWNLVIVDEGHYLKTIDAQRTRAVFGGGTAEGLFFKNGIDRRAERMISLTGTPLPNRPRECYTMARGLDWSAIDFLSEDAFSFRFSSSVQMATGYNKEVKGRLPELQARLRCNFMVRRHKKDVLPQLPDKRYEMTYLEPNGDVKEILKAEAMIEFNPEDLFNSDFSLEGTPISTLRREMGEAMLPEIIEYLRYQLTVVELPKILVFAHHKSVIAGVVNALHKFGISQHHGQMNSKQKEAAKEEFIDGLSRIMLCQLDTTEGVDGFQEVADHVFFPEAAWTPGRNEQCVDRLHRLGQEGSVIAHFLLIEGSFNEKVLNLVLGKAADIHEALDRRLM